MGSMPPQFPMNQLPNYHNQHPYWQWETLPYPYHHSGYNLLDPAATQKSPTKFHKDLANSMYGHGLSSNYLAANAQSQQGAGVVQQQSFQEHQQQSYQQQSAGQQSIQQQSWSNYQNLGVINAEVSSFAWNAPRMSWNRFFSFLRLLRSFSNPRRSSRRRRINAISSNNNSSSSARSSKRPSSERMPPITTRSTIRRSKRRIWINRKMRPRPFSAIRSTKATAVSSTIRYVLPFRFERCPLRESHRFHRPLVVASVRSAANQPNMH